ncbi:hypothetical protein ACIP9X_14510 [Arthrobacter sp. NPDC093125]|uniref:hypothetical protein n=1 Tax=Arthrobacter sp. NPDC093125 TaxID=3363944 RepID=UPI00381CA8FF
MIDQALAYAGTMAGAYTIIIVLFGVGQVISTAESLSQRGEFGDGGLLPWRILQLGYRPLKRLQKLAVHLFEIRGMTVLLVVKLISAASLILLPIGSVALTIAIAVVILVMLAESFRNSAYGGEGSDQMGVIIGVALFIGCSSWSSPALAFIGLTFIAAQSVLSYLAAGVSKVVSTKWRSGSALVGILETEAYGLPAFASILRIYPKVTWTLTWTLLLFETTFALSLVAPAQVTLAYIAGGVLFHLTNAVVMGLNSFFWMFTASYPAVLFVSLQMAVF